MTKAEHLCSEFASHSIEETFLAARWSFALKLAGSQNGETGRFVELAGVSDCIKPAVIAPSNLEWYCQADKLYFKGGES